MGQEDKELLIKELCARLPYDVALNDGKYNFIAEDINIEFDTINGVHQIIDCKPYLFPLSSMTEEQYKEFNNLTYSVRIDGIRGHHEYFINPDIGSKWLTDLNGKNEIIMTDLQDYLVCIDWLNKHHFDYHRLIDKGLAIDCTNLNIY